jgi:uncharacterized membrane protein
MKVVSNKNIPMRMPLVATVAFITALHYWNAPSWAWGAVCTYLALVWVLYAMKNAVEEKEDIFKSPAVKEQKDNKFKQKLDEAMDELNKAK